MDMDIEVGYAVAFKVGLRSDRAMEAAAYIMGGISCFSSEVSACYS